MAEESVHQWCVSPFRLSLHREMADAILPPCIIATWDMEELLGREAEIVEEDKLKVRMVI